MMQKNLQQKLNTLPPKPGVYQFFNTKGKILYIGKAKSLPSRVRSYWQTAEKPTSAKASVGTRGNKTQSQKNTEKLIPSSDLTPSKQKMVSSIANIEYTITDNETEALLLETNLIKEHKPPYNVVLKDDKYWQYIVLDYSGTWPQIYASRRPDFRNKKNTQYFGPYTSGYAVKETLRLIKKIFPVCLKPPKKALVRRSLGEGGCFNYHLGRCLGPCVGQIMPKEYAKIFEDVKKFIKGRQKNLLKQLNKKMQLYSQQQHFEAAGRVRDQIKALQKLNQRQKVVLNNNENIDIISLHPIRNDRDHSLQTTVALNLFKVRQGKLLDKFNSIVKAGQACDEEIIETFIKRYYTATMDLPQTIFSSFKLSFNQILNMPVKQALRGKKLQLVKLGQTNAQEYLKQQETFFNRQIRNGRDRPLQMAKLQKILKLPHLPRRIETYDISNIQGQLAVGSMVVFVNGQPKKSEYRRFKIKLKQTPDDPAMMREVIERRLKNNWQRPDLIVIDGGITQLNAAVKEIKKAKTKIPVISLAKREEEIYLPKHSKPLTLSKRSPALQLLQRGRDEAHRFAISYYRLRHQKQALSGGWENMPGIGPKTQSLLKKKYKTLAQAKKASAKELEKLIGKSKTKIIKEATNY